MNLYKTILPAAAALMLAAVTQGCSDWLDYTPKDKQTYEQIFSTPGGFHTTVNGIYNSVGSSALYGYNLTYGPLEAMGLGYNIVASAGTMKECATATYTGSYASGVLSAIWSNAYTAILNTNLVLEALDAQQGVLKDDDAELIRAEMLAMRAWLHLDLARLFGPIPKTSPTGLSVPYAEDSEVYKREQLPLDSLITYKVLRDLDQAETVMARLDPIVTEGTLASDGGSTADNWGRYRQLRLNYYAVILLKARAYLWMSDYDSALAEASKITGSAKARDTFPWVVPSRLLGNSSNPDRGFSTECLFGLYNKSLADVYKNSFSSAVDALAVFQPAKGYVNGTLYPDAADYRFQSQWATNSSMTGGFEFIKYKSFTPNATNPEFWATFYGLMRLPEAYYIAAECCMAKGETGNAIGYLNTVLAARGVQPLDDNAAAAAVSKEIELEYVRELRCEGHAFFLLKRLNTRVGTWYSPTRPHLNGGASVGSDAPSPALRYTVPIPSGETY